MVWCIYTYALKGQQPFCLLTANCRLNLLQLTISHLPVSHRNYIFQNLPEYLGSESSSIHYACIFHHLSNLVMDVPVIHSELLRQQSSHAHSFYACVVWDHVSVSVSSISVEPLRKQVEIFQIRGTCNLPAKEIVNIWRELELFPHWESIHHL